MTNNTKPSREIRRKLINANQWSKPNVIYKNKKDYDRQKEKHKTRTEAKESEV